MWNGEEMNKKDETIIVTGIILIIIFTFFGLNIVVTQALRKGIEVRKVQKIKDAI